MDAFLAKFWWLKSKKVWAFIIGVVGITGAAFQVDPFPYADFTMKLVALIVGFQASNAVEDGMKAQAQVKAATTTVTTPGASDVQVTAPETPAPAHPMIGRMG